MKVYSSSGNVIWPYWIGQSTAITANTSATTIWYDWNNSTASTANTYARTYGQQVSIWTDWNGTPALAETPKQRELRELQAAQYLAEQDAARAERERKRTEASNRAKRILREQLTESQWAELEATDRFHVKAGDHIYRLERKAQHNVFRVREDGSVDREYCAVLSDASCPLEDLLLGQKLLLETDESAFKLAANEWEVAAGVRRRILRKSGDPVLS